MPSRAGGSAHGYRHPASARPSWSVRWIGTRFAIGLFRQPVPPDRLPEVAEHNWGVAKLVKAPDFDSGMRGFESFLPSHFPDPEILRCSCRKALAARPRC